MSYHVDLKDAHLRLQAEVSGDLELAFYRTRPEWDAARSVLDLGCGNGASLGRIARAFPDKAFVGLDANRVAIERARADAAAPNVEYVLGEVDALDPARRFDVMMSRCCLMYVGDRSPITAWVGERVDIAVVQVDNDDALFRCSPELAEMMSLSHMARWARAGLGTMTAATTTAPEWASIGFLPSWEHALVVGTDPPHDREAVGRLLALTAELGAGRPLPAEVHERFGEALAAGGYLQYGLRASWFTREGWVADSSPATLPLGQLPSPPEWESPDAEGFALSRRAADNW